MKPEHRIRLMTRKAQYLKDIGEYDQAMKESEAALSLAKRQSQKAQAGCLAEMFDCCVTAGSFARAKTIMQEFRQLNEVNSRNDPQDYFRIQAEYGELAYRSPTKQC
jgi:DNA mismatch repair ATPase MutS